MGFKTFWKHVIFGYEEDDPALIEARKKYGIEVGEEEDEEEKKEKKEEYDPWDEIRNMRANFFFGSWATKKYKHRVIGEDKVKKQLAELEKKRQEEARKKVQKEKGEG